MKTEDKEKIDNIIINVLNVKKVTSECDLANDLGMDSLDLVEIVMMIECEFSINLDDDNVLDSHTVGAMYGLVEYELSRN